MSTTWTRAADGVWRNINGNLYERPKVSGKFTFRTLGTSNLKLAKEEYCKRRSGNFKYDVKPTILVVGEVINRYQQDGYPDRQRKARPTVMHEIEERNCRSLLLFWNTIPVDDVRISMCDRYHGWRTARIKQGKPGNRTVDNELSTLSNAFTWAARCELIKANPLATRPHYRADSEIKHCREAMPDDSNHLHQVAGNLFRRKNCSAVLGWQMLVEAYSGLRTCEALQLRWDAQPYQPGWITPDGKSLCVRRAKGQQMVNPFVAVNDGLKECLAALKLWHQKWNANSPWFFPSFDGVVCRKSLAHALAKMPGKKLTSHGMRAFYVTVRRSHGIPDNQIAFEIGHTSGGKTLADVYGGVPPHWLSGDGPKMTWLPAGELAWAVLNRPEELPHPAQNTGAPAECHRPALAA